MKKVSLKFSLLCLLTVNLKSQNPYWRAGGNTNAGPDPVTAANNFFGTTAGNPVSIIFRTNGTNQMILQNGSGFLGIGLLTPTFRLDVQDNGKTIESKKMVKNQ